MEERNVNTWEDFEKQLQDLQRERDASSDSPNASLLFRGQEDSCWLLKTTLDRKRERMLRAPSIPRSLRDGWDSRNSPSRFVGGHDLSACL